MSHAAQAPRDARIPVVVVTGFLGSGKSTLINRLLSSGVLTDTAIVVNELGAAAIDHHLLRVGDDRVRVLDGGCVCCSLRGGLTDTLQDLFLQAVRRQIPRFSRIVIETTGLADPSSIVFTLRHDAFLAERYVYAGALVAVDAEHGLRTQVAQPEWLRQVALADHIVVTKRDRAPSGAAVDLEHALDRLAPGVPRTLADLDGVALLDLDEFGPYSGRRRPSTGWLGISTGPTLNGDDYSDAAREEEGALMKPFPHPAVRVVSRAAPHALAAGPFLSGLAALQAAHGEGLLRIKGIVRFAGRPGRLQVFHGVHGQRYPLSELADEDDISCAVVLIARGPDADALETGLRDLVAETAVP